MVVRTAAMNSNFLARRPLAGAKNALSSTRS
jgi:hypothetical protein